MSSDIVAVETQSLDAATAQASRQGTKQAVRWVARLTAAVLLIAFLIATVPLVITLPQCLDCSFFDLIARDVLRGNVVYRDYFLHAVEVDATRCLSMTFVNAALPALDSRPLSLSTF